MAKNRVHWIANNQTSETISLGVNGVPAIPPNGSVDILLYTTMEIASQSPSIKILLDSGAIVIDKKIESITTQTVDSTNSFNGLVFAEKSELDEGGGGGGGNPFDQSLNTTDNVQFNQIVLGGFGELSIVQVGGQPQLMFNNGEQNFMMGFDSNRAIPAFSFNGQAVYMGNGAGTNGQPLFMDGGTIQFPTISGEYYEPAYIGVGTVDVAGGGLSLFCNAAYECNWQNGVLKINGDDFNGGGTIQNVGSISGPSLNAPTTATATLVFDPNNLPPDVDPPQLIVLTMPGNNGHVFYYLSTADGSDPTQFNLNSNSIDSGFITNVINGANIGCSVSFDNVNTITFTMNTQGSAGNQSNGSTLANCTITNFTGGGTGPNLLTIDSNLVVNGTLAFTQPYTTLTEADNGINLDGTYDTYFLYVGTDFVQFTVNLPDPSTMPGRELTFISTGANSEFYPSIFGNISQQNNQSGPGLTYNLSNTTVKMLSDGNTWWITSQV